MPFRSIDCIRTFSFHRNVPYRLLIIVLFAGPAMINLWIIGSWTTRRSVATCGIIVLRVRGLKRTKTDEGVTKLLTGDKTVLTSLWGVDLL